MNKVKKKWTKFKEWIKNFLEVRFVAPYIAAFLIDLILINFIFGNAYYFSFQKIYSYFIVGSLYIILNVTSKTWKHFIPFAIAFTAMILYVFTSIYMVNTFNKAPYFSDFLDIGIAGSNEPMILVMAIVGAAGTFAALLWAHKFYKSNATFKYKTPFLLIAVISLFLFPLTNTLTNTTNGKWYSYKSYAQENRNQYGDVAMAEIGVFGSMFLGDSKHELKPLEAFESLDYTSEFNGAFEGRNVNILLVETFDYLSLNEEATPALFDMYTKGLKFNNYFVPSNHYVTCRSEFQIITGKYAPPALDCPWEEFGEFSTSISDNNMFTAFNNEGYTTNYYHSTNGDYYDRAETIPKLGSDFVTFTDPDLDPEKLPTTFRDEEFADIIVSDLAEQEKYLNFWLTFDGHSPFNKDYVDQDMYQKFYDRFENDELAGLQYNMWETDKGIEKLVNAHPDDVFIVMADHNAYAIKDTISEYRKGLEYFNVPFFIYGNGMEEGTNTTAFSQFDVLPMIYDIMGIAGESGLHGANPLALDEQWFTTAGGEYYKRGLLVNELTFDATKRKDWDRFISDYSTERISMIEGWQN